jgi:hypothetical protein
MGENVTTSYYNNDGSLRDMYKPECFIHPGDVLSDYFSCTTYADNGGVHKNSGILNRLYAVLVDGGEYADPDSSGQTITVDGLGFVKATNLFWRTHQELVPFPSSPIWPLLCSKCANSTLERLCTILMCSTRPSPWQRKLSPTRTALM